MNINQKQWALNMTFNKWLMMLVLCIQTAMVMAKPTLPDIIQRVKKSVVSVATVMLTRTPRVIFYGTGFVVANGRYVITNDHVVPSKINHQKKEALVVFMGEGSRPKPLQVRVVLRDALHDLVLLRINEQVLPALTVGESGSVREGERFAFTGFPIGMVLGQYPVTHEAIVSGKPPLVSPSPSSRQLTAEQIKRKRNPYKVFQLDAIAYPGNSGSPLYDVKTGIVRGIVNSVFVKGSKETALTSPSGITYAIPSKHIKALLKKAGLE